MGPGNLGVMRFVAKVVLFSLLVSVLGSPLASAAESKPGITISPVQKELVVSSGLVEATTNVVVTNNTGKNLVGSIRLVDFKTLNETGGLLFSQAGVPSEKYGLANWMTLPNGEVINVLNGQSATIPVHITNRADLAPGGHYGAVIVTLGTAGQTEGSRTAFKQELVSLILVKKLGGEDYGLLLDSMKVDRGTDVPSAVTLKFSAGGNTHVTPRGYVTVADSRGKVISKGTINAESTALLPGTSRQMITLVNRISETRAPGRLKVTAYFRNDEQKDFTQHSIYINSFNWQMVVLGALLLTGVVALLAWFIRRRKSAQ